MPAELGSCTNTSACSHQPLRRGQETKAGCLPATLPCTSNLHSWESAATLLAPGSPLRAARVLALHSSKIHSFCRKSPFFL